MRGVGSSNLPVPTSFRINSLQNSASVRKILREGYFSCKDFRLQWLRGSPFYRHGWESLQAVQASLDLDKVLSESTRIPHPVFRKEYSGVVNAQSTIHLCGTKRLQQRPAPHGFTDSAHCLSFHLTPTARIDPVPLLNLSLVVHGVPARSNIRT